MGALDTPFLSIITVNLNNADQFEQTIRSVLSQENKSYEYIIIDGGSSDNSVEIINKYKNNITYCISEKDNGIYHAMNKGIIKANGKYCLFLNSGDILYDSKSLSNLISTNPKADIVNYSCYVKGINQPKTLVANKKNVSFYDFYKHTIIHQATLIKKDLFKTIGLYNENLKIVADWEFFIKSLFINNCSYQSFDLPLTVYNSDGLSSKKENQEVSLKERELVLNKFFPRFIKDFELLDSPQIYTHLKFLKQFKILRTAYLLKTRIINFCLKQFKRIE